MSLLSVDRLTMRFGGLTAVKEVSFEVEPGQIFSIIGPNGAGKTTVFNAITGIYDPTAGQVLFQGRDLRHPWRWQVWLSCLAVGLATAVVAMLALTNVDKLWYAAIKRNNNDPQQPFTYAAAWRDSLGYLRGDLAISRKSETSKSGQTILWIVEPANSDRPPLAISDSKEGALTLREELTQLARDLQNASSVVQPVKTDRRWGLQRADGTTIAVNLDSQRSAEDSIQYLSGLVALQAGNVRKLWLIGPLGLIIGTAGALSIWNRARRTPDVIALGGIARTFQNIRLFPAMCVGENVLVGMDRSFAREFAVVGASFARMAEEVEAARQQALKHLEFVGLEKQVNALASSLPYGDQRRLEIARALATQPKLLLLDEPAAGMNPAETADLTKLIRRIRDSGVTVLLIEHHMRVVMGISDRIAVLDYGAKIAEGTPEEVRKNPRVIEAYLGKEEVT